MSALNCRPGDLAIVVRSYTGKHWGKIVRCVRCIGVVEWQCGHCQTWITDHDFGVEGVGEKYRYCIADDQLRPLRPGEGADETLSWKDVPSPTKEAA